MKIFRAANMLLRYRRTFAPNQARVKSPEAGVAHPNSELTMNNPTIESHLTAPSLSEFDQRLVTLADGRAGLRGSLQIQTCEPPKAGSTPDSKLETQDHAQPILDFIVSDETL